MIRTVSTSLDLRDGAQGDESPLARLSEAKQDLAEGSSGPTVVALHDYLKSIGYFPNPDLEKTFPNWQPVLSEAPSDPAVFDDRTVLAVKAYQHNNALPVTGVVDEATRKMIAASRCGVPDGVAAIDPADKWALIQPHGIPSLSTIRWAISGSCSSCLGTNQQVHDAVVFAAAAWSQQTSMTLIENNSAADIIIVFQNLPSAGFLAQTTPFFIPTGLQQLIQVNTAFTFSLSSVTPSTATDFQTIILHELGHALGIDHSSVRSASMFPTFDVAEQRRVLKPDDATAVSVTYDTLTRLPGQANDIAVGGNGAVWSISNTPVPGGFTIQQFDPSSSNWVTSDGIAVRVAVETNGTPWVIASNNTIWRRTSTSATSGSWQQMPGCATDIAAGGNTVWSLGCTSAFGGFNIQEFTGTDWVPAPGIAQRIAVGPTGIPVVLLPDGRIFRFSGANASTGSWSVQLPNSPATPDGTSDIFVDAAGFTWLLPSTVGPAKVLMQNQTVPGTGVPGSSAPAENQWWGINQMSSVGLVMGLAAGPLPGTGHQGGWFVGTDHSIWRQVR